MSWLLIQTLKGSGGVPLVLPLPVSSATMLTANPSNKLLLLHTKYDSGPACHAIRTAHHSKALGANSYKRSQMTISIMVACCAMPFSTQIVGVIRSLVVAGVSISLQRDHIASQLLMNARMILVLDRGKCVNVLECRRHSRDARCTQPSQRHLRRSRSFLGRCLILGSCTCTIPKFIEARLTQVF